MHDHTVRKQWEKAQIGGHRKNVVTGLLRASHKDIVLHIFVANRDKKQSE